MKLIEKYETGHRVYECDCGHKVHVGPKQTQVRCIYCGRTEEVPYEIKED